MRYKEYLYIPLDECGVSMYICVLGIFLCYCIFAVACAHKAKVIQLPKKNMMDTHIIIYFSIYFLLWKFSSIYYISYMYICVAICGST